jgi:hypothetical protein
MSRQCEEDCPTPREVRYFATDLRAQGTRDERISTKYWWRRFNGMKTESLRIISTGGMEDGRREAPGHDVH